MNKNKLYSDLRKALNTSPIYSINDVNHTIKIAADEFQKHRPKGKIGYMEFLFHEISFIGAKIWLCQGILLISIYIVLNIIFEGNLKYILDCHIPDLLCFFTVFTTMIAIPFLCRSHRYKMYELESSTYMPISKLLSSRLIIIGIGDIILLIFINIIVLNKVNIPTVFIILYSLLPFLISFVSCIFILRYNSTQYSVFICEAFCLFLLILQPFFHRLVPQIYYETALSGWIILTILFAALLAFQIYKLLKKPNKMCIDNII
ncbi:hypothetical protein [Clostridium tyrobutyricum]|uniref:hypothetical protein n=1 Tax=Clostridium tyrobutyricum TaxID=1519 RepID=UPI001C382635|nr:hypothetical protein [Clostridium tyrobutyricum]MBV4417218.1 hypothetical protein [Clostridium tyrobutyricum]MBV4421710.1 hypothetical protein [Clostridium tyrobutyricum]